MLISGNAQQSSYTDHAVNLLVADLHVSVCIQYAAAMVALVTVLGFTMLSACIASIDVGICGTLA